MARTPHDDRGGRAGSSGRGGRGGSAGDDQAGSSGIITSFVVIHLIVFNFI